MTSEGEDSRHAHILSHPHTLSHPLTLTKATTHASRLSAIFQGLHNRHPPYHPLFHHRQVIGHGEGLARG
jgi:hypothetical protein